MSPYFLPHSMRIPFSFVFLAASLTLTSCASCFYPNGKPADGLIPCNATAPVSHCCREADVCLSNGLCFSSGLGSIVRRGCTDNTWNSTSCPNICSDVDDLKEADAVMTPCGPYGTFCCGQTKDSRACCDSGNNTLNIGAGEPICNATVTMFSTTSEIPSPTASDNGLVPSTCSSMEALKSELKTKKDTVTGLVVALGCVGLALVIFICLWLKEWRRPIPGSIQKSRVCCW